MSIKLEAHGLNELLQRLAKSEERIRTAAARAANTGATRGRTMIKRAITQRYGLKSSYVDDQLSVRRKATPDNPEAIISARRRPIRLARFGAKQLMSKAKSPLRKLKGDALRGIPRGKKAAGVRVKVMRAGAPKRMPGAFVLPLRDAGVAGVFIRTGRARGAIKHLYGPSPYQLMRYYYEQYHDQIGNIVSSEFARQIDKVLK